jgi:hypothetical protein
MFWNLVVLLLEVLSISSTTGHAQVQARSGISVPFLPGQVSYALGESRSGSNMDTTVTMTGSDRLFVFAVLDSLWTPRLEAMAVDVVVFSNVPIRRVGTTNLGRAPIDARGAARLAGRCLLARTELSLGRADRPMDQAPVRAAISLVSVADSSRILSQHDDLPFHLAIERLDPRHQASRPTSGEKIHRRRANGPQLAVVGSNFSTGDPIHFRFGGTGKAPASVAIYDVQGRCLEVLPVTNSASGVGDYHWDLTDRLGSPVATGWYFARAVGTTSDAVRFLVKRP